MTVRIQDTGIGMDEKTVERIFQPFEQAAPEVDAEGFGLGLTITRGLVSLLKERFPCPAVWERAVPLKYGFLFPRRTNR